MSEMDPQLNAIREGMSLALPLAEYSLVTPRDMEALVCGNPHLSVEQLRQICSMHLPGPQADLFWQCMERFDATDRCNLLRFATGYRRAPVVIRGSSWENMLSVCTHGTHFLSFSFSLSPSVCVFVCSGECACMRVCTRVRACVRVYACVCVCVCAFVSVRGLYLFNMERYV